MAVVSPHIWYPQGPTGPAYDLRRVQCWTEGDDAEVRFESGHLVPIEFDLQSFLTAKQASLANDGLDGGALLSQCYVPAPDDFTWSQTGSHVSPLTGETVAAASPDYIQRGGLYTYFAAAGGTNLVADDITAWSKAAATGNTASISDNGDGSYRIVLDATSGVWGAQAYNLFTAVLTSTYSMGLDIKLVSGSVVDTAVTIQKAGSPYTTYLTISLSDLVVGEWTTLSGETSALADTGLAAYFVNNGNSSTRVVLDVRHTRVTESTSLLAPFAPGSASGATYGHAAPFITGLDWSQYSALGVAVEPYYYSGAGNPVDTGAYFFEALGYMLLLNPGSSTLGAAGYADAVSGGSLAAGSVSSVVSDWSDTEIGQTFDAGTRVAGAGGPFPSLTNFYLGNSSGTTKPLHAKITPVFFPTSFSSDQRAAAMAYAVRVQGGFVA